MCVFVGLPLKVVTHLIIITNTHIYNRRVKKMYGQNIFVFVLFNMRAHVSCAGV